MATEYTAERTNFNNLQIITISISDQDPEQDPESDSGVFWIQGLQKDVKSKIIL